jgi:hypothetical protein
MIRHKYINAYFRKNVNDFRNYKYFVLTSQIFKEIFSLLPIINEVAIAGKCGKLSYGKANGKTKFLYVLTQFSGQKEIDEILNHRIDLSVRLQ